MELTSCSGRECIKGDKLRGVDEHALLYGQAFYAMSDRSYMPTRTLSRDLNQELHSGRSNSSTRGKTDGNRKRKCQQEANADEDQAFLKLTDTVYT